MATLSSWTPDHVPSITTLSSINPTHITGLESTISSILAVSVDGLARKDLVSLQYVLRGAQASMTIVQAENVIATATDEAVLAQATSAIFESTLNLVDLKISESPYNTLSLDKAPNIIYLIIFALTFLYTLLMIIKSRYHWYNVAFSGGLALEFMGFLGRTLSLTDAINMNYYLLQLICLTIAPAFLMGGIYFLFAQLTVIHGRRYSLLKPMWYSYFFIGCDILSLVIQAIGGAMASIASKNNDNAKPGTDIMIAGIAFQVVAMSVFLVFWISFLVRSYFRYSQSQDGENELKQEIHQYDSSFKKRSFINFIFLLFNGKKAREYKSYHLEQFYNPKFASIRSRKLFSWFPLVMTIAVIAIYIRCIYRVVELAQGFSGYLMTHEVYLMVLDALMITIVALLFVPFHPYFVLGPEVAISVKSIKGNHDEQVYSEGQSSIREDDGDDLEGTTREVSSQEGFDKISFKEKDNKV